MESCKQGLKGKGFSFKGGFVDDAVAVGGVLILELSGFRDDIVLEHGPTDNRIPAAGRIPKALKGLQF